MGSNDDNDLTSEEQDILISGSHSIQERFYHLPSYEDAASKTSSLRHIAKCCIPVCSSFMASLKMATLWPSKTVGSSVS